MANNCGATIAITGSPTVLRDWLVSVLEPRLDLRVVDGAGFDVELPLPMSILERLDPVPRHVDPEDHWGSQHPDRETRWIMQGFGRVYIETVFAYGPPEVAFDRIAAASPELTFTITFSEIGFGEIGTLAWAHGHRILDTRVNLN